MLAPQAFPLTARRALPLFSILALRFRMCCRKDRVLSNLTPRKVGVGSWASLDSPRNKRASCRASCGSRVKMVATVFSVLTSIFHLLAHLRSSSSATCTFLSAPAIVFSVAKTARSSANSVTSTPGGKSRAMSLMKRMKSSGDSTAP